MQYQINKAIKLGVAVIALILLVLLGIYLYFYFKTAVPEDYTKTVQTGGTIEAKYMQRGPHRVAHIARDASGAAQRYDIYYPEDALRQANSAPQAQSTKWPLIVFANGTGVPGSRYSAVFEHMASWGFIVIGNEDLMSGTGESTAETLSYILELNDVEESRFFQKIDVDRVGICGHSQGGAGVFNAITSKENSGIYKTAVVLSPANEEASKMIHWDYDLNAVQIPVLMLAGTEGSFETMIVIPFENMTTMYEKMPHPKAMARKTGKNHPQMLYEADGYVTAWFMWRLQGDSEAGAAFEGGSPELLRNPLYQDQRIDLEATGGSQ